MSPTTQAPKPQTLRRLRNAFACASPSEAVGGARTTDTAARHAEIKCCFGLQGFGVSGFGSV